MSTYSQSFQSCLSFVLSEEGGVSDRPPEEDPGGLTNLGITQATLDAYRDICKDDLDMPDSVLDLTREQSTRIYHKLFWLPCRCDSFRQPISLVVFNAAVQSGPARAAILLQRAVRVRQDGIIGPITQRAVYALEPSQVVRRFLCEQGLFEMSLSNWEPNKRGWLSRLFGAALAAAVLAGCTSVSADLQSGTVRVDTFMTSRQDVVVEHLADGTARWSAKQSDANASLAEAVLNLSKVAAGVAP